MDGAVCTSCRCRTSERTRRRRKSRSRSVRASPMIPHRPSRRSSCRICPWATALCRPRWRKSYRCHGYPRRVRRPSYHRYATPMRSELATTSCTPRSQLWRRRWRPGTVGLRATFTRLPSRTSARTRVPRRSEAASRRFAPHAGALPLPISHALSYHALLKLRVCPTRDVCQGRGAPDRAPVWPSHAMERGRGPLIQLGSAVLIARGRGGGGGTTCDLAAPRAAAAASQHIVSSHT